VPAFLQSGPRPPLLPLALGRRAVPGLGLYFLQMPVTSEDNRLRGVHLWGLPKTLGQIESEWADGHRTCRVSSTGEHLFTLRVPTDGRPVSIAETVGLFGRRAGALTRADSHVRGVFHVRKFPATLFGAGRHPARYLELGSSAAALALAALDIRPTPLELRYSEAVRSVLELPRDFSASARSPAAEVE
jgi:hypothetical protein